MCNIEKEKIKIFILETLSKKRYLNTYEIRQSIRNYCGERFIDVNIIDKILFELMSERQIKFNGDYSLCQNH